MPRIRTIKPEFWDSPDTARASFAARLLYIAMWNWADDWGVGSAHWKSLAAFAFPNDDEITASELPTLAKEVSDTFGVTFYEVNRRPYYSIPSWDEHQRTERKAKRANPLPPEDVSAGQWALPLPASELPPRNRGTTDSSVGKAHDGTGEQGNRGTGEREGELASASSGTVALRDDDAPTTQTLIAEWIDHCTERPPGRVIGQVSKELKTLLDEGIDPDRVRRALAEWNRKGLHPSTLASVVHEITNRQPAARGQQATDDMFERAMQRAIERDSA